MHPCDNWCKIFLRVEPYLDSAWLGIYATSWGGGKARLQKEMFSAGWPSGIRSLTCNEGGWVDYLLYMTNEAEFPVWTVKDLTAEAMLKREYLGDDDGATPPPESEVWRAALGD